MSEALHETSEALTALESSLTQLPAIVWTTDASLRFTMGTGVPLADLGLQPNQLTGVSLFDYFGTEDAEFPPIRAHYDALEGRTVTLDVDWAGRSFQTTIAPLRHGSDVTGCIGLAFDITDRRTAERELESSHRALEDRVGLQKAELAAAEQRYQSLLDTAPVVAYAKDAEGRYLLANRRFRDLFHVSQEELVGRTDAEVFPQDMAAAFRENDLEVLRRGEPVQFHEVAPHDDGNHHYDSVKFPLRNADGHVYGTAGISTDVTARRKAEEALRVRQRAIECTSSGVFILDATRDEKPVVYVNPAFERMTGYTSEELVGRSGRLLLGTDLDQPALDELRSAVVEGRECHVLLRNYRKDGSPFWNDVKVSPVRDDDGRLTHFVGVQQDVTAAREAEQQIRQHQEELAQVTRLATLGEIASEVAHELSQPIGAARMYAAGCLNHLDAGTLTDAELREKLEKIIALAERGRTVIDNLRGQARRQPQRTLVDLNETVRTLLDLVEFDFRQRGIEIQSELQPELPLLSADRCQIEQILMNFVRNALDAVEEAGTFSEPVRVRTCSHDDAFVELTVEDRGVGIDPEVADELLTPYFTTKAKGLGIGLSICRKIAENHGGRLSIFPRAGGGAVATLLLPFVSPIQPIAENSHGSGI